MRLDVRLVVGLELEGLAANAAGQRRQRERALLLLLFLLQRRRRTLLARSPVFVKFLRRGSNKTLEQYFFNFLVVQACH